jgi:hypothetical protein
MGTHQPPHRGRKHTMTTPAFTVTDPKPINTVADLCDAMRVGLFADRDTITQAWDFAYQIAQASPNPAHVMTAVGVMVNTIAKVVKEMDAQN